MIEVLIYVATAALALGMPIWYVFHERRKYLAARRTLEKAVERGLDEPMSLHPFIDPAICIGTAACVKACPEVNVLGTIANRGALINPARCVGHGACQAACPVDAITLVFGTEKRGVDIPYVRPTFESNVEGVYIAGELGGMGLIRNAVAQGRQAARNIALSLRDVPRRDMCELLIVGAGPAGIAAALQAQSDHLNYVIVDQEDFGGAILTYPRRKLVMTQPVELPLYGQIKARELLKEQLIDIFTDVFAKTGVSVRSSEKVENVVREGDRFRVVTARETYETRRVLLAIGRRGTPRRLGVPGEKSDKVAYRLLDPEKIHGSRVLVVGGGDSAVESALALAEQPGNVVHLSYRREAIFRIKEGNQTRIEQAFRQGTVVPLFRSAPTRIEPDRVLLERDGGEIELRNDLVFIFAGGELPTEFLKKIGIEFTRKFGQR